MPTKSTKRKSASHTYETVPNDQQVHFPATKRTIRDKPTAWSAPSKYQQTITQMNPFHAIFHPQDEDCDLNFDEEETQAYVASPVGNKRRKIRVESPPARKIETRSSARKAVKTEPLKNEDEVGPQLPQRKSSMEMVVARAPAALMPPPRTPQTSRRKEIPSSQSPVDSPLSTHRRTIKKVYARSPLKERFTNPTISTPTHKAHRWTKKLQVADSYEDEENQSPVASPVQTMKKAKDLNMSSPVSRPLRVFDDIQSGSSMKVQRPNEIPESSQRQILDHPGALREEIDVILDSEAENDDTSDQDTGSTAPSLATNNRDHPVSSTPFNPACIPFPGLKPPEAENDDDDESDQDTGDTASSLANNVMNHQVASPPLDPTCIPFPGLIPPSKATFDTPRKPESAKPVFRCHKSQSTNKPVNSDPDPRSDSQEASAQLSSDLHRATAPGLGGLQTESQYENAWESYHPAAPQASQPSSSPLEIPSSIPHEVVSPAPEHKHNTIPTQILPPSATPFRNHQQGVPTISQATTTDCTQPSSPPPPPPPAPPRRQLHHPSSSSILPSSPPPLPPPSLLLSSSSPIEGRRGRDLWAGWEWNGERLTDSQLLPESLLNDSIGGPPLGGWCWGEEEEELEEVEEG